MLTSFFFVEDQKLASRYCFARIAGPFIGAIIAGIFFLFQREILNEADKLFVTGEMMNGKRNQSIVLLEEVSDI
jgi:hypothetical protein